MMPDNNVATKTRALICQSGNLTLQDIQLPLLKSQEIVVQVIAIGLCRTDLYAISGEIKTHSIRFVPGHEFAGIVVGKGSDVVNLNLGDPVAVNPVVSCGDCPDCNSDSAYLCSQTTFMGVDIDGACSREVIVQRAQAIRIPESLEFAEAAFAEPVAASLAILKANIHTEQNGLIIGSNRIAELARRVLLAHKFKSVSVVGFEQSRELEPSQFDFVVEADASTEVFEQMTRLVRPRGTLVLKSRQHRPLEFTLRNIIEKEPRIEIVNYGRFEQAVQMLADGDVVVDDLVGQKYPLAEFANAIADATADEAKKIFLVPGN